MSEPIDPAARCVCEDRYDEHRANGGPCARYEDTWQCNCPGFQAAPPLTLEDLGVDVL